MTNYGSLYDTTKGSQRRFLALTAILQVALFKRSVAFVPTFLFHNFADVFVQVVYDGHRCSALTSHCKRSTCFTSVFLCCVRFTSGEHEIKSCFPLALQNKFVGVLEHSQIVWQSIPRDTDWRRYRLA